VDKSWSTVKPDGTSENSDFGGRMDHERGEMSHSYMHANRILHRAAPKVRKNPYSMPIHTSAQND
jgi:hypothetical protein